MSEKSEVIGRLEEQNHLLAQDVVRQRKSADDRAGEKRAAEKRATEAAEEAKGRLEGKDV